MCRQGAKLVVERFGATHLTFSWSRAGAPGRLAVRIPVDALNAIDIARRAGEDTHLGVELEALIAYCVQVDGLDDSFEISQVLHLVLGAHSSHPERHAPHVRDFLDLLVRGLWHLTLLDEDGSETVVVDWRPLVAVERGRFARRCTLHIYPLFKDALVSEMVDAPASVFSLAKPENYSNPEGRIPSRATTVRGQVATLRSPLAAARSAVRRLGWRPKPGTRVDLSAREIYDLAGIDLDKIKKRGRTGAWFDAMDHLITELLPGRARRSPVASRVLETTFGFPAPPPAGGPSRRGPPVVTSPG